MEIEFSLNQIQEVAEKVLVSNPQKVILFNGEMGVGKTTFIKALAKQLGVLDETSSPTFSIVNEYATATQEKVYHFDVYRLNSEEEALDMGIEEYLYSENWCFIEWAEKIPNLIPTNHSQINIMLNTDGKRKLILTTNS
ncbi:MAG: tRNA threonylcarbamoyladenosine biosynthesis protein TsaE [Flavobacterium sp.]|jgi:tRNA threonylcarbamoyladenosine biosynthesis protein TsaE